jgi:hypothetical protein
VHSGRYERRQEQSKVTYDQLGKSSSTADFDYVKVRVGIATELKERGALEGIARTIKAERRMHATGHGSCC